MRHTATALASSPNSHQLEARILTNHASDERFAFLRGRWTETWSRIKSEAGGVKETSDTGAINNGAQKVQKQATALIGGYDSSDEDSDGSEAVEAVSPPHPPPPPPPDTEAPPPPTHQPVPHLVDHPADEKDTGNTSAVDEVEAEKQRQRRLRVEEWKRKRAREG